MFVTATICKYIFGLAQKIWTSPKHFGTCKRTRHKWTSQINMFLSFSQIIAYGLFVFSLFLIFLNSSFISKSLTKAITIYNSQRPSDISNRSLPPAPPPPMGTQIPNPIGPPSIPMQEHSLINQAEPPTTSNFQNRGLCGLRWGLKNKTLLDVWRFLKHFGALHYPKIRHIFFKWNGSVLKVS